MTIHQAQSTGYQPQFGGLEQSVRSLGARVAQPLLAVGSNQSNKPIQLAVSPLIPSIAVGTAALYQHGLQKTHPNSQNQVSTRRMLVESGFGYLMAAFTSGVFPLLYGMGLSAYRAGQKDNVLDKLHAIVNTVSTLSLGYMGIFLFSGLSEGQHRAENEAIHRALKDPKIYPWLTSLMHRSDAPTQELTQTFQKLYANLESHEKLISTPKPDYSKIKTLRGELNGLKANAWSQLQTADETLLRPENAADLKAYQGFREALSKSQRFAVKFARITNPLAGFFLMGLMLGPVAAKKINNGLDRYFPQLRQKQGFQKLFSQDASIIPKEFSLRPFLPPVVGTPGGVSTVNQASH